MKRQDTNGCATDGVKMAPGVWIHTLVCSASHESWSGAASNSLQDRRLLLLSCFCRRALGCVVGFSSRASWLVLSLSHPVDLTLLALPLSVAPTDLPVGFRATRRATYRGHNQRKKASSHASSTPTSRARHAMLRSAEDMDSQVNPRIRIIRIRTTCSCLLCRV